MSSPISMTFGSSAIALRRPRLMALAIVSVVTGSALPVGGAAGVISILGVEGRRVGEHRGLLGPREWRQLRERVRVVLGDVRLGQRERLAPDPGRHLVGLRGQFGRTIVVENPLSTQVG